jgi:hypothetical protein
MRAGSQHSGKIRGLEAVGVRGVLWTQRLAAEASEREAASVRSPSRDGPAESDGQQLLV